MAEKEAGKTGLLKVLGTVAKGFMDGSYERMRKTPDVNRRAEDLVPAMPGRAGNAADIKLRYDRWQRWASERFGGMENIPEDASFDRWHKIMYGEMPPDVGQYGPTGLQGAKP